MRVAVLSDIHGNLAALEAVLADAGEFDALWCLGDTVGYGPRPNECVEALRSREQRAVAGNHDLAAIGKLSLADFNPYAAAAARWTANRLSTEVKAYLETLPLRRVEASYTLVHGSPREPVWEYLLDAATATASFAYLQTPVGLVGHTHVASYFAERGERVVAERAAADLELDLSAKGRLILNPGSVGQPRDDDPRAAYLLLDTDRSIATWRRVPYDIGRTQAEMAEAGLPRPLIERLERGW